jgi:hypothetical protein
VLTDGPLDKQSLASGTCTCLELQWFQPTTLAFHMLSPTIVSRSVNVCQDDLKLV